MKTINPWQCLHESTELRRKTTRAGTSMFGYQCLLCGKVDGQWVKKATIESPDEIPSWDAVLEDRALKAWLNQEAERRSSDSENRRNMWFRAYTQFLDSPEWRAMRKRVHERAGGICESCLMRPSDQVHHTAYPKTPPDLELTPWRPPTIAEFSQQPLWELRAVCYQCHAKHHAHMREAA